MGGKEISGKEESVGEIGGTRDREEPEKEKNQRKRRTKGKGTSSRVKLAKAKGERIGRNKFGGNEIGRESSSRPNSTC